MIKLEKKYKSSGCDISLTRLCDNCEFIAPSNLHVNIKHSLEALVQIQDTSFEIDEPGFEVFLDNELGRLMAVVKSKCVLEKNVEIRRIYIPMLKSRLPDPEDGVQQNRMGTTATNSTSVVIGHSTVTISIGDLTAQSVRVMN